MLFPKSRDKVFNLFFQAMKAFVEGGTGCIFSFRISFRFIVKIKIFSCDECCDLFYYVTL